MKEIWSDQFLSVATATATAATAVVVSKNDYYDDKKQQRVVTEKITHIKDFLPSKDKIFEPLIP